MFKNNQLTSDDHYEHRTRVEDCVNGLHEYSGALGILASLVTEIEEYAVYYAGILVAKDVESDEWHAAVIEYETKRTALIDAISDARWMVKSILEDPVFPESTKDLLRGHFNIDEKLSVKYETVRTAGEAILLGQAKLEELDSEWVLPDDLVTRIENALAAFVAARTTADTEKLEKLNAMDVIYEARENGHRLLRKVYRWVIANWGDDDERLFAFGFVPKSAIWTEGDPEPGAPEWPVHPEAADFAANYLGEGFVELVYSKVTGAVKARLRRRLVDGVADWEIVFDGLPMGGEEHLPFRERDVPPGKWEYEFVSYNEAVEPSEPAYATVIVPEEIPA